MPGLPAENAWSALTRVSETAAVRRRRLLTLSAEDLHVQVRQAAGGRQRQLDHALDGDRVTVQVVEKGAVLVIVRHQPQLSPGAVVWRRGDVLHVSAQRTAGKDLEKSPSPLLSAAMNPRMFSCRSMIVW